MHLVYLVWTLILQICFLDYVRNQFKKKPKTFSPFLINVLTFKWTSALYYLHLFTRHFSYNEFFIFLTMFKLFCSPLMCIKIFKSVWTVWLIFFFFLSLNEKNQRHMLKETSTRLCPYNCVQDWVHTNIFLLVIEVCFPQCRVLLLIENTDHFFKLRKHELRTRET